MDQEDKKLKARIEKQEKKSPVILRKQKSSTSNSPIYHSHLNFFSSIGNKGMGQLLQNLGVQAKSRVSQPEDPLEQEADKVADQMVSDNEPSRLSEKESSSASTGTIPLHKKKDSATKELEKGGTPLEPSVRDYFEPRFGVDLGNVYVHTDSKASMLAGTLNARAVTYNNHIAFGRGEYQPDSLAGKKLLAHELAHVQQQKSGTFFRFTDPSLGPNPTSDFLMNDEAKDEQQQLEEQEALDQKVAAENEPLVPEQEEPQQEEQKAEKQEAPPEEKQEEAQEQNSEAPPVAGAGDGGTEEQKAPEIAAAASTSEVISNLKNVKPSQSVAAFNQSQEQASQLLSEEQKALQESVPKIQAPTGLTPVESAGAIKPPEFSTPPPVPEFKPLDDSGTGKEVAKPVIIPEGQEMNATLGDAPTVKMNGAADPGQMNNFNTEANTGMQEAKNQVAADMQQDFGENNIFPKATDEIIEVEQQKMKAEIAAEKLEEAPALSADAVMPFDANVGPALQDKIAQQEAELNAEKEQYDQQAEDAKLEADDQIGSLNEEAAQKQLAEQEKAQAEVNGYKEDWQSEVNKIDEDFQAESNKVTEEHSQKIQEEQQKGESEAARHYQEAQNKAETEKQKAQNKANAETKKKKEEKKGGVLGFLQDVGNAIVEGLKTVVNAIYEGLKSAIKFIFEAAKKLALAAIDLARKAITLYIKAMGAILKTLVSVALAAFPELAKKINSLIDKAINKAIEGVNIIADGLKTAVTAVLDFLSSTLIKIFDLIQSLYNAIFTVIGMLIRGEIAELMKKIGNLIEAAKMMPAHFEGAAWEELLGFDISKPLPMEGVGAEGEGGNAPPGASALSDVDQALLNKTEYTAEDFVIDPVEAMEASPELAEQLAQMEDGQEVMLAESNDPDRSTDALKESLFDGELQAQNQYQGMETMAPAQSNLSRADRAKMVWDQMKTFLADWFAKNWLKVLGGLVAAIAGFIALNIVTGGAIMAALPVIMNVVSGIFIGLAVVKIAGHIKDYVTLGWSGEESNKVPAAKSLAKGLAAGAIELIMALGFRAVGAAAKGVVKGVKAGAKAVKSGAQATVRLAKGAFTVMKTGAGLVAKGFRAVVKAGKFVFQGIKRGFMKVVKTFKDLGKKLLARFKFKGFKIVRKGWWFQIWGKINPWILVTQVKVDSKIQKGAIEWSDDAVRAGKKIGKPGNFNIGDDIVEGIIIGEKKAGSQFVNALKNNPQIKNSVIDLIENAGKVDNELLIRGLSKLQNPGKLANVVKGIENCKNIDSIAMVLDDLARGGNKTKGAEWVLDFIGKNNLKVNGLEVTMKGPGGIRRYDAIINGVNIEFKNWEKFYRSSFLKQMAKDLQSNRQVKWIFSQNIGTKGSLIDSIKTVIGDTAYLTKLEIDPKIFKNSITKITKMIEVAK